MTWLQQLSRAKVEPVRARVNPLLYVHGEAPDVRRDLNFGSPRDPDPIVFGPYYERPPATSWRPDWRCDTHGVNWTGRPECFAGKDGQRCAVTVA